LSSTHTAEHPDAKHAGGRTGRQPRRRSCPDAIEPPRQGSNAPLRGVQRSRPSSFRESAAEGASLFRQSKIVCGVKCLFRRQLFCFVIRPVCPYCVSRTYDGHGVDDPPWSERHRRCFGCASQFPPTLATASKKYLLAPSMRSLSLWTAARFSGKRIGKVF
jgi:hypothetical protein